MIRFFRKFWSRRYREQNPAQRYRGTDIERTSTRRPRAIRPPRDRELDTFIVPTDNDWINVTFLGKQRQN